jgi:hypothetical protein
MQEICIKSKLGEKSAIASRHRPDFSRHLEKSISNLTPLIPPARGEEKGCESFFWHVRGRIQSLSPCRREVWREVFQIPIKSKVTEAIAKYNPDNLDDQYWLVLGLYSNN